MKKVYIFADYDGCFDILFPEARIKYQHAYDQAFDACKAALLDSIRKWSEGREAHLLIASNRQSKYFDTSLQFEQMNGSSFKRLNQLAKQLGFKFNPSLFTDSFLSLEILHSWGLDPQKLLTYLALDNKRLVKAGVSIIKLAKIAKDIDSLATYLKDPEQLARTIGICPERLIDNLGLAKGYCDNLGLKAAAIAELLHDEAKFQQLLDSLKKLPYGQPQMQGLSLYSVFNLEPAKVLSVFLSEEKINQIKANKALLDDYGLYDMTTQMLTAEKKQAFIKDKSLCARFIKNPLKLFEAAVFPLAKLCELSEKRESIALNSEKLAEIGLDLSRLKTLATNPILHRELKFTDATGSAYLTGLSSSDKSFAMHVEKTDREWDPFKDKMMRHQLTTLIEHAKDGDEIEMYFVDDDYKDKILKNLSRNLNKENLEKIIASSGKTITLTLSLVKFDHFLIVSKHGHKPPAELKDIALENINISDRITATARAGSLATVPSKAPLSDFFPAVGIQIPTSSKEREQEETKSATPG